MLASLLNLWNEFAAWFNGMFGIAKEDVTKIETEVNSDNSSTK